MISDDEIYDARTCPTFASLEGNYTKFLFDLVNDPYEITNLYDDETYADIKVCVCVVCACVCMRIETAFLFTLTP